MSEKKTISFPVADNPSSDAVPVFMLDSDKITEVTVTSEGVQHACSQSTEIVWLGVSDGDFVLVGSGETTDSSKMWEFFGGHHPVGIKPDDKTISLKSLGAPVVVKIQENG